MKLSFLFGVLLLSSGSAIAQTHNSAHSPSMRVPSAPDADAKAQDFHDRKFGVRFTVPAGWSFHRKDGEISTFHLDARSAPHSAQVRGVASLEFNPYPHSTLAGATFYYSVQPHAMAPECTGQADFDNQKPDVQDIGGMEFRHGHDESGMICTEARDEVYTAFRKGACYRFDLELNTFCSVSSGAKDLTDDQIQSIDQQMADILSTVSLDWNKGGAHPVPAPRIEEKRKRAEPEIVPRSAPTIQKGL